MQKTKQLRIIRKSELTDRIGVSGVTIWRWEKAGNFPKRLQLGGHCVGWLESEVDQWLEDCPRMAEKIA